MTNEWKCPKCGTEKLTGVFCGNCGTKKPVPTLFVCEKCKKLIESKFCETCGEKATEIEIILEEKDCWKSKYGSDGYFIVKSPNLSEEELEKILGFTMIEKPHKYQEKWDDAMRKAKLSYDTDGYTDWRLPSIEELKTVYKILKLCGINEKFDKTPWFWSSSVQSGNSDYAWSVYFYDGVVATCHKSSSYPVRCVR